MALAAASILLAPSAAWLVLTFALLGASTAGSLVSGLNIILEFCAPEDRPTYIGLTNTLLAPAPPSRRSSARRCIHSRLSGTFLVAVVLALVGCTLLLVWVRSRALPDGRRRPAPA